MKKWLLWMCIWAIGLAGCQEENPLKDPEYVATAFMKAMHDADYERAKELATRETQASIDMQAKLWVMGYNPFKQQTKVVSSSIEGQHAKVWFRTTGKKDPDVLKLRKTGNGEWRVRMSKADPGNEPGVNWAWDWLEQEVPAEKRWELAPEIQHDTGAARIAHQFLTAVRDDSLAQAGKLTDQSTRIFLRLHSLAGAWTNPFVGKTFKLTGEEVVGDTARVLFRQKDNNLLRRLTLVQEAEEWKVQLPGSQIRSFALENLLEEALQPLKSAHEAWEDWKQTVDDWWE